MDQLLDSLCELTDQRDPEALARAAVKAAAHLAGAPQARLYALDSDGGLRARPLAAWPEGPLEGLALERRPHFLRCLDGRQAALSPDRRELVLPLLEGEAVSGFLVLASPDLEPTALHRLQKLLTIYRNQAALLRRQHHDALTGLFNRNALDSWLGRLRRGGRRAGDEGPPGCLAMLDIDHFKRINDSLGHLYGDEVLLILADLMRNTFRAEDLLFRYGGEEFVAVLQHTRLDTAREVLERFRQRVAQHPFPQINQVTVSIGFTAMGGEVLPTTLLDRADQALYRAKRGGRNRVCAFEDLHLPAAEPRSPNVELFAEGPLDARGAGG